MGQKYCKSIWIYNSKICKVIKINDIPKIYENIMQFIKYRII